MCWCGTVATDLRAVAGREMFFDIDWCGIFGLGRRIKRQYKTSRKQINVMFEVGFFKGCSYWYAARFMEVENGCFWKAANNSCREPLSTSTMDEGYLSCSSHPCWVPTIWSHSNICTYPAIVTKTNHTCLVGDRYQPSLATGASQNIYTWDVLLSQWNMKIHVKDSLDPDRWWLERWDPTWNSEILTMFLNRRDFDFL